MHDEMMHGELAVPPQSIEAEQALLGGLLLRTEVFDDVAAIVCADDFYRHDHRQIFTAIGKVFADGDNADAITVGNMLAERDQSMTSYVLELAASTPSAANVEAYAKIVRDKSVQRQLIDASHDTISELRKDEASTDEVLEQAEQRIFAIAQQTDQARQGFVGMQTTVTAAFKTIHKRSEAKTDVVGLPSGFTDLDAVTHGFEGGSLIILAARPSMGKTALALNIAEYAALGAGQTVAVFSMEMGAEQLTTRLLSSVAHIDATRLHTGRLDDGDWQSLSPAIRRLTDAPLHIDDSPALSPQQVRARARRLARDCGGLGLIVVDYLQLMQVPGSKENRTGEVSEISRSLKALAKELNVPVMALSQLNRSLESRTDKRPMMSDLRESGAIEQDADVIMFIYRDEYYTKQQCQCPGEAEVIIAKNRSGSTATVRMAFRGQYTRFDNLSRDSF